MQGTQEGSPVSVAQVHPQIWREALRQADGDIRRLRIVSPTHVDIT